MLGHRSCSTRRVVRDVADAGIRPVEALNSAGNGVLALVDDPVEVGEDQLDTVKRSRSGTILRRCRGARLLQRRR